MPSTLHPRGTAAAAPAAGEAPAARELVLLASARALHRSAGSGRPQKLLRGKNIGLLCEAGDDGDAELFRSAALELGAHVAHIRPKLTESSTAQEVVDTARMLGRLYDAVECQGLPQPLVERIALDAGVPVFDGIATGTHALTRLTAQFGADVAARDARRFLVQAVLLSSIG
jgi:ornithine carbamoyltransferase